MNAKQQTMVIIIKDVLLYDAIDVIFTDAFIWFGLYSKGFLSPLYNKMTSYSEIKWMMSKCMMYNSLIIMPLNVLTDIDDYQTHLFHLLEWERPFGEQSQLAKAFFQFIFSLHLGRFSVLIKVKL